MGSKFTRVNQIKMEHSSEISVLLAMPEDSQMHQVIAEHLRLAGFRVYLISTNNQAFRYPSWWAWVWVKLKKILARDEFAKRQLISKVLLKQHDNLPDVDYTLFIRGDVFHADFIRAIKRKTRYAVVNYQWDGMNRFPYIWQTLPLFDRCYAFNPEDVREHANLLPATNFYFVHPNRQPENVLPEYDFYFLGAHRPDRMEIINQFSKLAHEANWQLQFLVSSDDEHVRALYPQDNIQIIHQNIDFKKNLDYVQRSRVLVDFVVNAHSGLSLRTFDALGYRKKLITTNATVAEYDFYHPDNIYIFDGNNFAGIADFLARPYHEIDPKIREKYSFHNWIRYVFNIEPYQAITLPK